MMLLLQLFNVVCAKNEIGRAFSEKLDVIIQPNRNKAPKHFLIGTVMLHTLRS